MGLRDALKTGSNYFFVVQGGIISSAVVLLALWAAAEYWPRVEIMGWYYTIIPVGAIAAGFAAALGYILAAMHAGAFRAYPDNSRGRDGGWLFRRQEARRNSIG